MILSLLLILSLSAQEPPKAEYPYPETLSEDYPEGVEKPAAKDASGQHFYKPGAKGEIHKHDGVESPVEVDGEGVYYYDTEINVSQPKDNGVELPTEVLDDGSFRYDTSTKNKDHTPEGVDRPEKINPDGSYTYLKDEKKYDRALYLRLGVQTPYAFSGGGGMTFKDMYSDKPEFIINLDYEWKLFDSLGLLLFKVGSGLGFYQGDGRFTSPANAGKIPKEKFQFILFPNTATFTYKMEGSTGQWLIPYFDFGAGYFTFMEQRNDNARTKFGGAPVVLGSAGLLVNLEPFGLGTDPEDGYTRSWFIIQFRQHLGLDKRKDFTSSNLTAGIAVGW